VTPLQQSGPLVDAHDAFLLDLDGVVHLGDQPVEYAAAALADVRAHGARVVFVTNNASRDRGDVISLLRRIGVPTGDDDDVVTSAMVAADLLAQRLEPGAHVLVVGGAGLTSALTSVGLTPVRHADAEVAAVVQGWAPEVDWQQLAEASVALRAGAAWVATNDDKTLPSPRGPLPGNGSLVAALATATGLVPDVVGKPHPPLYAAAARQARATAPLFVGDRLDTDIAGANAAGMPSLLVLTGVAEPRDLLAADEPSRPTYFGADLRALLVKHPAPVVDGEIACCGDAVVRQDGTVVTGGDPLDVLRAACALAWSGALPVDAYDAVVRSAGLSR
jgi:glycerol-1-phosphatase